MRIFLKSITVVLLVSLLLVNKALYALHYTDTISIAGVWRFQADPLDAGVSQRWFEKQLKEEITLPGSMAENDKGDEITLNTKWTGSIYDSSFYFNPRLAKYREPRNIKIPFWLTPRKHYVGAAWYQKDVDIPVGWKGKRVVLYLERAHIETRVWVDGQEAGMRNSLVSPHEYDLVRLLTPGKHKITIRLDNRIKEINVGPDSHSITDHTQGNWNGIIGKMLLRSVSKVSISNIQVYPNIADRVARVKISLDNAGNARSKGSISVSALSFNSSLINEVSPVKSMYELKGSKTETLEVVLPMGDKMQLWNEFNPSLYRLTVRLEGRKEVIDSKEIQFGMREFKTEGNRFLINGSAVFLRGTVNNCEFPLTGYPAMDVPSWERIFNVAKLHGLNHMRFHSWCPPEAAFIAADKVGFYLQPEGPSWPNHGSAIGLGRPIDQYLYDETDRMASNYGNYASFCMLSAGNEPAGKQVDYLNAFVGYWKKKDSRRVYTGMSVGGSWPVVPDAEYQVRGGVRGLAWDKRPETVSDFSEGIDKFKVPFVAHEMGQWCVFPDFKEIEQYTGVYRARNFELFRQDLTDRGMADQADDFLRASGRLQALCYKNEIEKTLRTPGYAGFQLLGLQDFPGQGTALVGVLNAFWREKEYISSRGFSRFCNSTVPLARIPKFVYTTNETFIAGIDVFHSGARPLENAILKWSIKDTGGTILASGTLAPLTTGNANGVPAGKISFPLSGITRASKLNLEVSIENTAFVNDWNFWVCPDTQEPLKNEVYYTTSLDQKAKNILDKGGKVFLNAAGKVVKGKEVSMHFLPVFWNTSWFKMRPPHVTGMLIQSASAAFADFPTDFHSDLQWWEIANRSQVMILEDFPSGFRPLVQPIDTWFLNRRLGLIFEVRVGKGMLIVSSADLGPEGKKDQPASRQLYRSLIRYMSSAQFKPSAQVDFDTVQDIFETPSKERYGTYTKDSPDELKPTLRQKK